MKGIKKNIIIFALLATILAATLIVPQTAAQTETQDISVSQAKNLIKHSQISLIIDVRNQSEYDQGHIHNAKLIPLRELTFRIEEVSSYQNASILVYCTSGNKSAQASKLFEYYNFTNVYNLVGGINSWMQAGYDIDTSYHYATVDVEDNKTTCDIQPWLLHTADCDSCQNQQCLFKTFSDMINVTYNYLEKTPTHEVMQVIEVINGTVLYQVDKTVMWSLNETDGSTNRTISFTSSNITNTNGTTQAYALFDNVRSDEYNMTITTVLNLLNSTTYNSSVTQIDYFPAEGKSIITVERIHFNSSVTLSQLYQSLGTTIRKLGVEYSKSLDSNLTVFASRYDTIREEMRFLKQHVNRDLSSYNLVILHSDATLMDEEYSLWTACPWLCAAGLFAVCATAIWFSVGLLGTFCVLFANEIALFNENIGCVTFCAELEANWPTNPPPTGGISPHYASSVTYHGTISGSGSVDDWEDLLGPTNDGDYAQIYAGNYGDASAIGVELEEQTSGQIYLYGYSYSGYYSHIYVYASVDQQQYTQIWSGYVTSDSPQTISIGYCSNFRYIYIAGYDDEGYSCRMEIDAVSVTPAYYINVDAQCYGFWGESVDIETEVVIDDQYYYSPGWILVPAGWHLVRLSNPGYSYYWEQYVSGYVPLMWLGPTDGLGQVQYGYGDNAMMINVLQDRYVGADYFF